jgi:hypothetical protein
MRRNLLIVISVVLGIIVILAFVLTAIQGICIDYWSAVGGEEPPCWLPFGA